ncbi:threonine--tRNA ligase [Deinococcus maricopensis]|uniref:Threonine--tRNA ligase n=1 Tax=Deinococcus maricopensis (strain DSM 21211 / LMG 22137 / NRRL B-23946 / LB-34) TaxID=709986 RepID=E8U628_DEIML|nr:threonine--tRNA ligase [Deinococcus maricopensis]ADV66517.1 threonyl-tRNA synthetase [Deinococcus maricopensis DSM 21211]
MHVFLPDGKQLDLQQGATALDAARAIGPRLAQDALAATANGDLVDLMTPLPDGARITLITKKNPGEAAAVFRHSLGHVMSQAVGEFYRAKGHPADAVKRGVGPSIENGWYQDFDLPEPLREEDLPEIERIMREILSRNLDFSRREVSKAEALAQFGGDPYKAELIRELPDDEPITFYTQGDYTDLCRGPHFPRTGALPGAFKLMSTSGAYWRGNEKNPILQRIYGVAFATQKELDEYLHRLEEAKKRDHRKLGRELELFVIDPLVGKGLPMWLPNGTILREELTRFLREQQFARGYQGVVTPNIGNLELYKTSGHYQNYSDSNFSPITVDDEQYMLKPMNCPHHVRIYASKPRSYRDLPVRLAEFGTVYRYEQSGELNGLTRVRGFTQDDAHLFCRPDQLKAEFLNVLDLTVLVLRTFGMNDVRFRVGTRDPENTKYVGAEDNWNAAERQIIEAVEEVGLPYSIEPGDAAFYGPKLDFVVRDVLGREWQLGTIQVDYNLPERFDISYVGEDGADHRPIMIHRAPFGSLERFVGILIEHYGGDFPLWLAPRQVAIIPIADRHNEYAYALEAELRAAGLRTEVDDSSNRMNAKVRAAELSKIPVMLIVGDKEQEGRQVSVRERTPEGHKERKGVAFDDLKAELLERYRTRA